MGNLFRCEVGKKEPEVFFSGGIYVMNGLPFELPKVSVGTSSAQVMIQPPKTGKARIYVHVGSMGNWELVLGSSEFALDVRVVSNDIYEFEAYLEQYRSYYIYVNNNYDSNDIVSISATVIYI